MILEALYFHLGYLLLVIGNFSNVSNVFNLLPFSYDGNEATMPTYMNPYHCGLIGINGKLKIKYNVDHVTEYDMCVILMLLVRKWCQ